MQAFHHTLEICLQDAAYFWVTTQPLSIFLSRQERSEHHLKYALTCLNHNEIFAAWDDVHWPRLHLDISGAGFDKVLQNEIVSRDYRIAFTEKAEVLDEKTSGSDQLVKQRARWINTWFRYFKFGFSLTANGITKMDRNRFLFGMVLLRPPLFIFLALSVLFAIANFWISTTAVVIWVLGFVCFVTGFVIALVHAKPDKAIYRSLLGIPRFMFFQLLSLLKARNANKISVATKHAYKQTVNNINDEN